VCGSRLAPNRWWLLLANATGLEPATQGYRKPLPYPIAPRVQWVGQAGEPFHQLGPPRAVFDWAPLVFQRLYRLLLRASMNAAAFSNSVDSIRLNYCGVLLRLRGQVRWGGKRHVAFAVEKAKSGRVREPEGCHVPPYVW
jgi:hypothetical protein